MRTLKYICVAQAVLITILLFGYWGMGQHRQAIQSQEVSCNG